jgi:WD repeat-containing protein 68
MAVVAYEAHIISLLDARLPTHAVAELHGHTTCVNAVSWNPKGAGTLISGGDDGQVMVWDVAKPTKDPGSGPPVFPPSLVHVPHPAGAEVENLCVSKSSDWIAVGCGTQVKLLRL